MFAHLTRALRARGLRRNREQRSIPDRTELRAVWSERARAYGRRSVYDLSVPEAEFDNVTAFQEQQLYPLLLAHLARRPKRVLDYGCGAGRFTASLREITHAEASLGFDPCPELIELARTGSSDPRTQFTTGSAADFFAARRHKFDLIWIATVLGGLMDDELDLLADELAAALTRGGLLFFAENTAPIDPSNTFWRAHPATWYEALFSRRGVRTRRVGTYTSCGNEVSIFAGIKRGSAGRRH